MLLQEYIYNVEPFYNLGFEYAEEHSTDDERTCWFYKRFKLDVDASYFYELRVAFSKSIDDNPNSGTSWTNYYYFERVERIIYEHRGGNTYYFNDRETLLIKSLEDLEHLTWFLCELEDQDNLKVVEE